MTKKEEYMIIFCPICGREKTVELHTELRRLDDSWFEMTGSQWTHATCEKDAPNALRLVKMGFANGERAARGSVGRTLKNLMEGRMP